MCTEPLLRVRAQVALMFLTRGVLPQAPMWEIWLRAAAGRVPLSAVQAGGCGAPSAPFPNQWCC